MYDQYFLPYSFDALDEERQQPCVDTYYTAGENGLRNGRPAPSRTDRLITRRAGCARKAKGGSLGPDC